MKKTLKLISTLTACLVLAGCGETPTLYYNDNYKGEPIRVADSIYFKKVYIQGMDVLLQCDKDGNITHNQNINVEYREGKHDTSAAVLTVTENKTFSFNFKCSDINECYNQVMIVKNSLNK